MAELKAFLHRAGRNELTELDAIRALLFAFLVFLTLYLPAFRAGYYGEEFFAWLAWSRDHSLLYASTPPGGTYFRVLSVRLPYWLFPRLPFGLFLWKTLAFSWRDYLHTSSGAGSSSFAATAAFLCCWPCSICTRPSSAIRSRT